MRVWVVGLVFLAAAPVFADEGMWTFDDFPSGAVKQRYGADITPAWLDHVRLSTIRLTNCTASFVSPEGLILTNHHCVESCLAEMSSKDKSLELVPGAHYFEDSEANRTAMIDLVSAWIAARN